MKLNLIPAEDKPNNPPKEFVGEQWDGKNLTGIATLVGQNAKLEVTEAGGLKVQDLDNQVDFEISKGDWVLKSEDTVPHPGTADFVTKNFAAVR